MLFSLQLLIEKVRNSEDEAFIIFIDYSKAFDSVNHNQLFDTMKKMGFPTHLVSLIAALYDNQKATIRMGMGNTATSSKLEKESGRAASSRHICSMYTQSKS